MTQHLPLVTYGVIKLNGSDTAKFLQGQLTCNIDTMNEKTLYLAAHCTSQGRIVSLFHLFLLQNNFYMFMPREMIPLTITALKKYAVFYKVNMTDDSDAMKDNEVLATIINDIHAWKYRNIQIGIPAVYPETSGTFLPHDLNLPSHHAIDFEKGCYTGQEIIARMHYRGKPKNHLYQATLLCKTPPLPGQDIYYNSDSEMKVAGTLVDSYPLKAENEEYTNHLMLIVCDEANAKNNHLFLEQSPEDQLIILGSEK